MSRKGLGPIAIVIVMAVVLLTIETFAVRNLIYKHEVYRRIGMEQEYIDALNSIEVFKRFLPPIINFSYCETNQINSFKDRVRRYALLYDVKVTFTQLDFSGDRVTVGMTLKRKVCFSLIT